MNLRNHALRYLGIEPARVSAVGEEDAIPVVEIDKGIIFVWATWSGAAQLAIKALGKALIHFPNLGNVQIYIADNDTEKTQEFMCLVGHVASGSGETFWISNGIVQSKLSGYSETEIAVLHQLTQLLLVPNAT